MANKKTKISFEEFRNTDQYMLGDVINFTSGMPTSIYADSTGVKSPEMVARGSMHSHDRLLSEQYLMNYKRSEMDLSTLIGVANYKNPSIVTALANRDLKYSQDQLLKLPEFKKLDVPMGSAMRSRRSHREFSGKPMALKDLATLMFYAQGVTGYLHLENFPETGALKGKNRLEQRMVPSGGGLYPIDMYCISLSVQGLPKGVYKYVPQHHAFHTVQELAADFTPLGYSQFGEIQIDKANALFAFVYRLFDNSRKYGDLGLSFAFMEAGATMQNIHLAAMALGTGVCEMGGFHKPRLERLLKADSVTEHVIHLAVAGQI